MNLLTVTGLTKAYTDKVLFDNVSFSIHEHEKIGVIGINGTGKSSLLKILAGLEETDGGEVTKGNKVCIRYLPQNMDFPEEITLYEYVVSSNVTEENRFMAEGDSKRMLNFMGFTDLNQKISELSGGQKKLAMLAAALTAPCDILILDEPTNHLNYDMVTWLETELMKRKGALVMVTHDRYFLDRVCNRIVEIDRGKLYSYETNFEGFLEAKAQREEMELATYRKNQSILRMELEWVKRGARARSTKQKARMMRYEELKEAKAPKEQENVEIQTGVSRMGKKTVELEGISKSYGDRQVIRDFSYIFLKQDRVGFVGRNGAGKTTLMKILAGELEPDEGKITWGQTVKIGYFSQESESLPMDERVIDYIRDTAEYIQTTQGKMSASMMLERFLFDSTLQYSKIEKLSGGERRRLYLLKVLMEAPNLLILDEPTNDLDIQTLAILEEYLQNFQGIVAAVSHDRYFLDKVVGRIFAFEEDGRIAQYEGGFSDYLEKAKFLGGEAERADVQKERTADAKTWKVREKKLKFTYQEQKEYETIEEDIAALEEKLEHLDAEILKAATDFVRLNDLTKEKEETESRLEEKMERYVYLSDLDEKIKAQK